MTDDPIDEKKGDNRQFKGASIGAAGFLAIPPDEDDYYSSAKELLINYNERFVNESPILFRDSLIQQTLSCLIGKFKPNALLIGAAGVGKTKIVEDIARRLANDDILIPGMLKGYTIYELPLSNIVSGSGLVGDVEAKTKKILDFAMDPDEKVILFIDEIHMLVGSNDRVYDKIAQLLKPALARNDMRVIGATTLQEAQNLMDDPAFNRRFTRLLVDELTKDQTIQILDRIRLSMFNHYERMITLSDKILPEIVEIADEYKTVSSHRPDNAITLLDRAMADAYIDRKVLEQEMKDDPAAMMALQASPIVILSKSSIKQTAMHLMTGNTEKVEVSEEVLRESLSEIKGQDTVIDYLIDTIERDSLNLYPRVKPLTMLFAGNSGVGKSEVVKIIAKEITDSKPIILNMTEYNSHASINRIIGAPVGYIGSDSKAELPFDILESNPYQVILLDEFEKAERSVQRLFMSAFDEGYIKTAKGKTVDFTKSIMIATTNAGYTTKGDSIGFASNGKNSTQASVSELSDFFDIELLNRFTKILHFNPITEDLYKEILVDKYARNVSVIKNSHWEYGFLPDELDAETRDKLFKDSFAKEFGARPAERTIRKYIEDLILSEKAKVTVSDNA